ncbi:MAG: hypothetical protein ABIH21_02710 [Patescibacteria group bacterium]
MSTAPSEVEEKKIVSARIEPLPHHSPATLAGMLAPLPAVHATFDDGTTEKLFEYYPDEIGFSPSEFIGLTLDQALDLHRKRDVAYLRS